MVCSRWPRTRFINMQSLESSASVNCLDLCPVGEPSSGDLLRIQRPSGEHQQAVSSVSQKIWRFLFVNYDVFKDFKGRVRYKWGCNTHNQGKIGYFSKIGPISPWVSPTIDDLDDFGLTQLAPFSGTNLGLPHAENSGCSWNTKTTIDLDEENGS